MKRLITFSLFVLTLFAVSTTWAADIDGIWQVGNLPEYISVHTSGTTLIGVEYYPGYLCNFLLGELAGNQYQIYYSGSVASYSGVVMLTSPRTGTFRQNLCVPFPGDICRFPSGVSIPIYKVFP